MILQVILNSRMQLNLCIKLDRNTFTSIPKWVEDVRNERGNDVVLVVVGNKTDLVDKRFSICLFLLS